MMRSPAAIWIGRFAGASAALAFPGTAIAHHAMAGAPPSTFLQGILSGLAHPVLGPDHLVFLLVAGLVVAALPVAARLATAVFLVLGQVLGTALHLSSVGVPGVEALIALTVIAAGLTLVVRLPGVAMLAALFAASGVFHGYAYAESIVGVEAGPLVAYLVGLGLMQFAAVLGVAGAWTALQSRSAAPRIAVANRLSGGAVVAAGIAFLLQAIV